MSYKFLAKNGPTIAFALFVVCVVISIIPIFGGLDSFSSLPVEKQSSSDEGNIFMAGIYLSVVLLVVATLVAVLLSIWQVVSNPKASMKALISFGIVLVLFFVLYSMANAKGDGSLAITIERFGISDNISKIVSGGIQLSVLLLIGSFIITIVMEIWNFFKNQ